MNLKSKKLLAVPALALSSMLVLSACGGDDEADTSKESSKVEKTDKDDKDFDGGMKGDNDSDKDDDVDERPDGEVMLDDYSFNAPDGMEDATEELGAGNSSVEVAFLNSTTGESVNVVKVAAPMEDLRELGAEDSITAELEASGFTNVEFPGFIDLHGEDALVATSQMGEGDTTLYAYQVVVLRDGNSYVITAGGFTPEAANEYAQVIVDSWKWAD